MWDMCLYYLGTRAGRCFSPFVTTWVVCPQRAFLALWRLLCVLTVQLAQRACVTRSPALLASLQPVGELAPCCGFDVGLH